MNFEATDTHVACVTGAASGIGRAIAHGLAETGFRVAVVDVTEETESSELLSEFDGDGHSYVCADISSREGRQNILRAIEERYGRLELLVNNAGVAPRERLDILETTEESYEHLMSVNLKGPFFLTQLLARWMLELVEAGRVERPKVINISSISAYTSTVCRAEYCISKAGVSMMTRLYADRLAESGINVYEIRPGIIKTPMTHLVEDKYDRLIQEGLLPIARWGLPDDIAAAVVAIASGSFEYSTGQVFDIDGGFHLRRL